MNTFTLLLSGLVFLVALFYVRERRDGRDRRANSHIAKILDETEIQRAVRYTRNTPGDAITSEFKIRSGTKDRREDGWRVAYHARNDEALRALLSRRDLLRKANASVLRSLRRVRHATD